MVRVKVLQAIAYEGLVIRPEIDDSPRIHGRPAKITPIEAEIPRDLAKAFGPKYVKILGPAANKKAPADPPADDKPEGGEEPEGGKEPADDKPEGGDKPEGDDKPEGGDKPEGDEKPKGKKK